MNLRTLQIFFYIKSNQLLKTILSQITILIKSSQKTLRYAFKKINQIKISRVKSLQIQSWNSQFSIVKNSIIVLVKKQSSFIAKKTKKIIRVFKTIKNQIKYQISKNTYYREIDRINKCWTSTRNDRWRTIK